MRSSLRTLPIVAVLSLAPAASVLAAPDDVEATLDKAVTHAKVRATLLEKLGTDGLKINIDVNGDQVRLTGEVAKKANQELAKEVALSVKGVKSVDNQLTVSPEGERSVTEKAKGEVKDAVLESKVKGRLLSNVGKNALDIEVEAVNGVVSLRGTVATSSVKKQALSTAKTTKGVRKVVNLLKTA